MSQPVDTHQYDAPPAPSPPAGGARMLRALLTVQLFAALLFFFACVIGLVFVDRIELIPAQTEALIATALIHGVVAIGAVLAVALAGRFRDINSRWPRLMLIVMVAYSVLTVDRGLAIAYPRADKHVPIVTRHETRGWFHRVNSEGFGSGCYLTTNELGLRDQPIPARKPEGEQRVLFIGDSITFGFMLEDGERIAQQAQTALNDENTDRKVRCINAGVSGYATWQELDLLRELAPVIKPDVVVLQFCINDMLDAIDIGRGNPLLSDLDLSLNTSTHWSGIWRAISYHVAVRRNQELADARVWAQNDPTRSGHPSALNAKEDIYLNPLPEPVQKAWKVCLEDLSSIKTLCEQMSVPLVLVYSPEECQLGDDPNYQQPSGILGGWAEQVGIPFVDITPVWKAAAGSTIPPEQLFFDSIHPQPPAAKLMAETIAVEVAKLLGGPND